MTAMKHQNDDVTIDDEMSLRGIFLKIKDTAEFNFDPDELKTPQDCFEAYLTVLCADQHIYQEMKTWANDYIVAIRNEVEP